MPPMWRFPMAAVSTFPDTITRPASRSIPAACSMWQAAQAHSRSRVPPEQISQSKQEDISNMSDFSIKCEPVADTLLPVQSGPPKEPTFVLPPETPTLEAVDGIRFDFNNGLRIKFPDKGEHRCVFKDLDTDCLLYSMDVKPGCTVESVKKFYIRFRLEIYRKCELEKPIFTHDIDLTGKEVLIQLPIGALGDTIAWFSFVERFQRQHGCKLFCSMSNEIAELFRG